MREGAFKALVDVIPEVVVPPYRTLQRGGVWGPVDSAGWSMIFNAPYSSEEACIELKWAHGKGYVAHPVQQLPNRSVGMVIKQLRYRWYNGHFDEKKSRIVTEAEECYRNVLHCENVMQDMINFDHETWKDEEETVSENLLALVGIPLDLTKWTKLAGMDKYVEFTLVSDTRFCGEPLWTDETSSIEEEDDTGIKMKIFLCKLPISKMCISFIFTALKII